MEAGGGTCRGGRLVGFSPMHSLVGVGTAGMQRWTNSYACVDEITFDKVLNRALRLKYETKAHYDLGLETVLQSHRGPP